MEIIADFHIHSRYSRATSPEMDIDHLSKWAKIKGLSLLGTGDFTHPLWLDRLKKKLEPLGNGLFWYEETLFILAAEISSIFTKAGKVRKIHNLVFAPSFEVVDAINRRLERVGNLEADGRPILGLSAQELAKIVFSISENCLIIPAHVWTPWFSIFGSNSGFDSIEECFEEFSPQICAIETGLSSDPAMNWRLSQLDSKAIISCSDAHSPSKVGREATVLELNEINYPALIDAIRNRRLQYTIEFFPEEGKYHYSGHRNCQVVQSPEETKKNGFLCPVCGNKLTLGVMHRVEELADRPARHVPENAIPFKSLIPLEEIIAESLGKQVGTVTVANEYHRFISSFKNEFNVLLNESIENLRSLNSKVAQGIKKVREGKVNIAPGYDGVYGKVNIFDKEEEPPQQQLNLFG